MVAIARVSAASQIWTAYNRSLEARPLVTKCMTSLTGFAIGDTLAQVQRSAVTDTRASTLGH
jgi:hypothetical protein